MIPRNEGPLTIEKILGSSSRSSSNFVVRGNLVGYIASGGVVVCQVNKSTGVVQSQRFYCANSKSAAQSNAASSANGYLKLAGVVTETSKKTDEYGFPVGAEPEVVSRSGSAGNTSEYSNSPSANSEVPSISSGPSKGRRLDDNFSTKLSSRLRAINSIEISPDRRILAVGEVGYQPRILIYSLASDATTRPVIIIQEHQFGINSLCFSPDSTKLCSLGLMNDGFLNIWKIKLEGSAKTLTFWGSNKCSSVVNKVLWHESWIITLGLRHIKVWKIVDDETNYSNTIIKGRNVLLRNFLNSSFIDAAFLNFHQAYVFTDQGELATLSLNDEPMHVTKVGEVSHAVNKILIDSETDELILAGSGFDTLPIDTLIPQGVLDIDSVEIKPSPSSPTKIVPRTGVLAMQFLGSNKIAYLTDNEEIRIRDRLTVKTSAFNLLIEPLLKNLGGLKKCSDGSLVLWSKLGAIKTLGDGVTTVHNFMLPGNELIENSLLSLDMNSQGELFLGDKFGTLTILKRSEDGIIHGYQSEQTIRAHDSSINSVCYFEFAGRKFVASGSRDRTVQVFMKDDVLNDWVLLQTLAIHKGNIHDVIFFQSRLFVSSSDRTVSVHALSEMDGVVSIIQEKLMALKNSPTCMKIVDEDLIVSTSDKTLQSYSIKDDGVSLIRTFKLLVGNQESIQVENVIMHSGILVVTSSDKSIRCFNYTDLKLVSSGWGHSESILGLETTEDGKIVSASADGCLFEWTFKQQQTSSNTSLADSSLTSIPGSPSSKVLRKVLPPPGSPSASSTPLRRLASPSARLNLSSPGTRLSSPVRSPVSKATSPRSPSHVLSSPPRSQVLRTRVNSASIGGHDIDDIINRLVKLKIPVQSNDNLLKLKSELDRVSNAVSQHLNLSHDNDQSLQKIIENCSEKIVESVLKKIDVLQALENKENE
ncbi:unnamed protein product [Kuraishia capsulata CBS 1993]|uniref:Uncharacterized protein n=1 Tax=Kuraishia capsulata CBS 1993 TaxID=1382522 RepID=W6MH56_9ASCO|nr:uncharacterized protein KUCA_T00001504001 [Kuraishia capsulata CBS 1993]CDK25534.1 unnamed protein product [Kuraishia capsulata CBS 1993]